LSREVADEGSARIAGFARSRPDFAQLFEAMPGQYMILDRDMVYVEANPAYCASTERTREEIVGRNVFEAFPPTGEGGRQIEESLRRVLVTGVAETLPLAAYPIPAPEGGFRMKYWSCVHLPLFDENGEVAFVAQNAVDVTELQQLKTLAYGPDAGAPAEGESDLFRRAQEVTAVNDSLAAETRGLRDLFMQAPGFMAVLMGPELIYTQVNNAYLQLIGHRPLIGRALADALPEVVAQGFADLLLSVMRDKTPHIGRATSVMLQRTPGSPLEERFVDFIFQPIAGLDGESVGVFIEGSDVTDRVLGDRQQRLLLDELNHRVKNTLRRCRRSPPRPCAPTAIQPASKSISRQGCGRFQKPITCSPPRVGSAPICTK
jgi:PAS domain-containing protein